jgi:hypothetical protein
MRLVRASFAIGAIAVSACGGRTIGFSDDASLDGLSDDAGEPTLIGDATFDAGSDADSDVDAGPLDCTYDDGGATFDPNSRFSGRFQGSCASGCPAGTVCAVEIGGVAGGGGEYCAPIMDRCKNDVTCACLASCVCGDTFGGFPQACYDDTRYWDSGTLLGCDNFIR